MILSYTESLGQPGQATEDPFIKKTEEQSLGCRGGSRLRALAASPEDQRLILSTVSCSSRQPRTPSYLLKLLHHPVLGLIFVFLVVSLAFNA